MNNSWHFEGPPQLLANTAAQKVGSIHDDKAAQKLGFEGAFVPGSVVGTSAMPAIVQRFGEPWLAGGWYSFNFVSPVYTNEAVRTLATESDAGIDCRIETSDGRLCAIGSAGLGGRPPWHDATPSEDPSNEVFPDARIGTPTTSRELSLDHRDAVAMLAAGCDTSPCWQNFVPPEHLMPIALHMIDFKPLGITGVKQPGMWAEHAILVRHPVCWGTRLRITEQLAAKGKSGRTCYLTFEFQVCDDGGTELAVGRHKCKFIAHDSR